MHRVPGAEEMPEVGPNGEGLKGNSTGYGPNGQGLDKGQTGGELDFLLPSVHCDESYPIDGEYDKKVRQCTVYISTACRFPTCIGTYRTGSDLCLRPSSPLPPMSPTPIGGGAGRGAERPAALRGHPATHRRAR